MGWFDRHSQALQAFGAMLTAAFALIAIIGVKVQLDAAERVARETQARDLYRGFLALSLARPEFAEPGLCPAFEGNDATAYDYYMEYALYTAEQVIDMDPSWSGAFEGFFAPHQAWLCSAVPTAYSDPVGALISRFGGAECQALQEECSARIDG